LTVFLGMDTYVELYKGGILPLEEFAMRRPDRDILVRIFVKKRPLKIAYLSQRNTKTDFPVLTCAVSNSGENWKAVIGARPQRAVVIKDTEGMLGEKYSQEDLLRFAAYVKENTATASNMRGSAEYRKILTETLVKRACMQIGGMDED